MVSPVLSFQSPDGFGLHRFSRRRAVAQFGEVEAREVRERQHAVDRRRRAEARDLVMLEDRQKFVGVELPANVVDEDAAADDPLSEIVPPQVLAPSRVGDGHMQVIGRKPMPEFGGDPMPERVGVGVQHHLRVFARAAGEDQQHRHIGLGMDLDRAFDLAARKLRIRPGDFGPVADPVRPFAVDEQPGGQRRAFVVNFVELVGVFGIGDDHFEFSELDPEFKVVRRQERRRRALNRAELDERDRKIHHSGSRGSMRKTRPPSKCRA